MKRISFSAIVLLLLAAAVHIRADNSGSSLKWITQVSDADVHDTIVYTVSSYNGGIKYTTTVYGRDLEGDPKWNEGDELPIGMAKVRTIAEQSFRKQYPNLNQFKLESIKLVHLSIVDKWLFDGSFNGVDPATAGPGAVEEKNLHLLVLLNGKVFTPVSAQGQ